MQAPENRMFMALRTFGLPSYGLSVRSGDGSTLTPDSIPKLNLLDTVSPIVVWLSDQIIRRSSMLSRTVSAAASHDGRMTAASRLLLATFTLLLFSALRSGPDHRGTHSGHSDRSERRRGRGRHSGRHRCPARDIAHAHHATSPADTWHPICSRAATRSTWKPRVSRA